MFTKGLLLTDCLSEHFCVISHYSTVCLIHECTIWWEVLHETPGSTRVSDLLLKVFQNALNIPLHLLPLFYFSDEMDRVRLNGTLL